MKSETKMIDRYTSSASTKRQLSLDERKSSRIKSIKP